MGVDPSKVTITKLKIDADRKSLLERKKLRGAKSADKGKYDAADAQAMANVD